MTVEERSREVIVSEPYRVVTCNGCGRDMGEPNPAKASTAMFFVLNTFPMTGNYEQRIDLCSDECGIKFFLKRRAQREEEAAKAWEQSVKTNTTQPSEQETQGGEQQSFDDAGSQTGEH